MNIALLHDHYDADHLIAVSDYMRVHGAPTIKAVWMECYQCWAALEGCHRIRAASALGLPIVIDEIGYSDDTLSSVGITVDQDYAISEIADEANSKTMIDVEAE